MLINATIVVISCLQQMTPVDVIMANKHSCSKISPAQSPTSLPIPQNSIANQKLMYVRRNSSCDCALFPSSPNKLNFKFNKVMIYEHFELRVN
jgi:hypothetical protein